MDLKEEWKKIEKQIEIIISNPNHIFTNTVIDKWLNKASYQCKCVYFNLPRQNEAEEITINQEKWDNILLKDFNFEEWKLICEDEYYPHSLAYFNEKLNIYKIDEFLPHLNAIIQKFKYLYDEDNILENLYKYMNEDFNETSRYILMTQKEKEEHSFLLYNRPLLKYFLDKH